MLNRLRSWCADAKRKVAAGVFSILAALGIYTATAQTVTDTVAWTNPTTRTDGSALTNFASSRVQWGSKPGGPYDGGSVTVSASAATASINRSGLGFGTRCYVIISIDAAGAQSAPSNEGCKTVTALPSPATNVTVQ
jgi:hypothetical protein